MFARKIHPWDGTQQSGKPMGKWLRVSAVVDHNPVDGPERKNCIILLEDGSWEFIWNLKLHYDEMVGPQLNLFNGKRDEIDCIG